MKLRKNCYEITKAERIQAEQVGRYDCPKCTNAMDFLDHCATKKEFYCPVCRVSVPLFAR